MEKTKQEIYEYLQTQKLMGLATFGDIPWPAIVYYVVDKELNLYFISGPEDQHCKNILKNNKVACTIYDSAQPNSKPKIGIQYSGVVEVLNDLEKVKWMVKLWNKIIAGKDGFRPKPEDLLKMGDARVYKISPIRIKFYNSLKYKKEKYTLYEQ